MIQTVLLPTDFSNNAELAIEYAISLFGTEVEYILLHAYFTPQAGSTVMYSINPLIKEEAAKQLARAGDKLRSKYTSLNLHEITMQGGVLECCKRAVKEHGVDLVAMGTTGASGVIDVFAGSNTASVMQSISCHVLSVPLGSRLTPPKKVTLASDYSPITDPGTLEALEAIIHSPEVETTIIHVAPKEKQETRTSDTFLQENAIFRQYKTQFAELTDDEVAEGLETFLQANETDMLVMIKHHYSFFQGLFHQSTTKHMALHGNVPLLVLREQ